MNRLDEILAQLGETLDDAQLALVTNFLATVSEAAQDVRVAADQPVKIILFALAGAMFENYSNQLEDDAARTGHCDDAVAQFFNPAGRLRAVRLRHNVASVAKGAPVELIELTADWNNQLKRDRFSEVNK